MAGLENRDRTRKSSVPVLFRQFERGQMRGTGSSNFLSPPISLYILPTFWRRAETPRAMWRSFGPRRTERAGSRRIRPIWRALSPCEVKTVRFSPECALVGVRPTIASPRDRKLFNRSGLSIRERPHQTDAVKPAPYSQTVRGSPYSPALAAPLATAPIAARDFPGAANRAILWCAISP
jgi:hypothetical protein